MQYRSTRGHAEPQSFSRILLGGLAPDGGSVYLLTQYVGVLRAKELTMTARLVGGEEAFRLGLVTELVDGSALARLDEGEHDRSVSTKPPEEDVDKLEEFAPKFVERLRAQPWCVRVLAGPSCFRMRCTGRRRSRCVWNAPVLHP